MAAIWAKEAQQIREVAAGVPISGFEVTRSASRGADLQLLVIGPGGTWWVTRVVAERVSVCAYTDETTADRDFDVYLAAPSPRGEWTEQSESSEPAA